MGSNNSNNTGHHCAVLLGEAHWTTKTECLAMLCSPVSYATFCFVYRAAVVLYTGTDI